MRARYFRISNILTLLDRLAEVWNSLNSRVVIDHRIWVTVTEYAIHFIITINVIALLKCRVFVLLNSGLAFSGRPYSCLPFTVAPVDLIRKLLTGRRHTNYDMPNGFLYLQASHAISFPTNTFSAFEVLYKMCHLKFTVRPIIIISKWNENRGK